MTGSQEPVECLGWRSPVEGLARPPVEGAGHGSEFVGAMDAEIGALREVLTQKAIGVLVTATLPGAMRIAEIDLGPGVEAQVPLLRHRRTLIPGQRPA